MKRKNTTRNALFTSIISLLLCVSMLVGTTFAWFTDEAKSGVNVINAGNLDVELYYGKDAEPNEKVDNSDKLFTDFNGDLIELWEPGVVAYTNLKVVNEGTLALTYQMAINFTNMNYVENDGARYTLADVLKVAVVEGGFTGDRAAAHALDYNYTLASFGLEGVLEADETTKTYGVVIYWEPNDNAYDNLFNLNNDKTSSDNNPMHVDLGISLFATQEMYEEDSFDDTYDENAKLELPEIKAEAATTNAFLEALAAGKTAVLTADLALDNDVQIPAGITSAIDLNGKTLDVGDAGIFVNGNLIVTNSGDNGSLEITQPGTGLILEHGSTLEVQSGVINVNGDGSTNGIFVYNFSADTTINLTGGKVTATGEANAIGLYGGTTDMVVADGTLSGTIDVGSSGTLNLTYYGETKPTVTNDDNTAVTVNYYNIRNVATNEELAVAIKDCANEIILTEGEFTADLYNISVRDSMIITGQGADTKLNFKQGQVRLSQFKNLTIENCAIGRMIDKSWGQLVFGSSTEAGGVYTISNCIFNGESTQGIYINQNVDATINIENCTFNGDFGSEGAITIQDNNAVFTVNVSGCAFNNIPETSHEICVVTSDPKTKVEYGTWNLNVDGKVTAANAAQLAHAVADGATDIYLLDGEYNVANCGGKTLTLNGSKNAVLKVMNEGEDGCDYGFGGPAGVGNITFNGLTIDTTANTGSYKGYAYMKGTFNDCSFVGAYSLNNANDFVFNRCSFDFRDGYFWTWSANSVTFNECTFGGNSKNILAHGYASTKININDCEFAATGKGYTSAGDWTSAVEIDPAGSNTYTINIKNSTINENYSGWTRVKDGSTGHVIIVNGYTETPVTNVEPAPYVGECYDEGANVVAYKDLTMSGSSYISIDNNASVAVENVTADVNGSVIVMDEYQPTIYIQGGNYTIDEGEYLIDASAVEGGVYQIFLVNVKVNGEILIQETAGQYLNNVNWYGAYQFD